MNIYRKSECGRKSYYALFHMNKKWIIQKGLISNTLYVRDDNNKLQWPRCIRLLFVKRSGIPKAATIKDVIKLLMSKF